MWWDGGVNAVVVMFRMSASKPLGIGYVVVTLNSLSAAWPPSTLKSRFIKCTAYTLISVLVPTSHLQVLSSGYLISSN